MGQKFGKLIIPPKHCELDGQSDTGIARPPQVSILSKQDVHTQIPHPGNSPVCEVLQKPQLWVPGPPSLDTDDWLRDVHYLN